MASGLATRRHPWWFLGLAVLVVALVVGAGGSWVLWRHFHEGQAMNIPNDDPNSAFAPWPEPAPGREATPAGPPFVTSVSPSGRYFLDQYGRPLLLKATPPGP